MPDKKLKKAMQDIKKILKRNDIAGTIVLVSPTHSEFLYHLSPSWSVITKEDNGFRFRSKKEDFPSVEIQNRNTELSTHILCQTRDISAMTFSHMEKMLAILSEFCDIEHESFKNFEPHQEE